MYLKRLSDSSPPPFFQEMSKFEEPDILFNMLNCLRILCLHGECLYLARKDHPQFLAYIQEKMLIPRWVCVQTNDGGRVEVNHRLIDLSNVGLILQSVVNAEVEVLSAGLPGCAAAPPRTLTVTWGGHLLEPHQLQLQQQGLEDTIRSR